MTKFEIINEEYYDEELLFADGFNDAVIGVAYDKATSTNRVIYSRTKCIDVLMERDGMEYEVAVEFFDFNVTDAYVGNKTPIFMDDEMFEE
jgi:hypothetical protein